MSETSTSMSSTKPSKSPDVLSSRALLLEAEINNLQSKLEQLGENDPEKLVNQHIQFLHQYNEVKDATQLLIGKLAAHQQITVKDLHDKYGLTNDD